MIDLAWALVKMTQLKLFEVDLFCVHSHEECAINDDPPYTELQCRYV